MAPAPDGGSHVLGGRAAVFAALAFAGGVLAADGTGGNPWILLAAGATALLAATWLAPRPGARTLALLGLALLGAAARASVRPGHAPEGWVTVQARVRAAEAAPGGLRLTLEATGPDGGRFGARVLAPGAAEARAGDKVLFAADLAPPPPALNPGGPDLRAALARRGVAAIGVAPVDGVVVIEPSRSFAGWADGFRRRFSAWALARASDPDAAALVVALSVGERAEIDLDLADAYNASGLAHLISISGLHLAVAALLVWRLLRALWARIGPLARQVESGRAAAVGALPLTAVYVLLAGAPAPAVRAGIGAAFFLGARILGREADALTSLSLAAVAILALDPGALFDPSFQLSFAAMVGLLVLAPRLRELVPVAPPDPGARSARPLVRRACEWVLRAALATLAASLATAPIVAAVFQRTSLWGLVSNLAALPLGAALVPTGLATAGLYALSPAAAGPALDLSVLLAQPLNATARLFATLPGAAVPTAPPSALQLWAYYAALASLAWLRRFPRGAGAALAASAAILLGSAGVCALAARLSREVRVTFLAVGQGDAAVARLPGGRTLVVDGGGPRTEAWDPGARVVAPFLAWSGARRVDLMLLSHPHPDHMDGLFAVLDRFPVQALWHNGRPLPPAPHALAQRALERGVDVRKVASGDSTDLGGAQLQVLLPLSPGGVPEWSENDNSIVARLSYGNVSFLFPGDAESEAEAAMAIRADVVKAPHHGSRTSSSEAFVRATGAHHVVICVGHNNRYGHPAPEVLARWEAAGCKVWRTDLDGAVTVRTDGERIEVEPFVKR